ncbi:MAG: hypothetical protein V4631_22065 [Pseudomonadota bacterium]
MTPLRLLRTAIGPALADLADFGIQDTPAARRFLLSIALQESRLEHRRQVGSDGHEDGPAASFWQFERAGGCRGVLTHRAAAPHMRRVCADFNIEPTEAALWEAMRYQDIVAATAARLLVLTLPGKLPLTASDGWAQYLAAWRPGKPHLSTWAGHWATADALTKEIPK